MKKLTPIFRDAIGRLGNAQQSNGGSGRGMTQSLNGAFRDAINGKTSARPPLGKDEDGRGKQGGTAIQELKPSNAKDPREIQRAKAHSTGARMHQKAVSYEKT